MYRLFLLYEHGFDILKVSILTFSYYQCFTCLCQTILSFSENKNCLCGNRSFRTLVISYPSNFVPFGHFVLIFGHFLPSNNHFIPRSFRTHFGHFVPSSTRYEMTCKTLVYTSSVSYEYFCLMVYFESIS